MGRTDSLEKTLMLGKIEGRRRRRQTMRWLDGITDSMDMSLSELCAIGKEMRPGMLYIVHGVEKSQTRLTQGVTNNDLHKDSVHLREGGSVRKR